MMEDGLLAEVVDTCKQARYGYCVPDCRLYYRHVSALLADRQELSEAVVALAERIDLLEKQLAVPESPREGAS
jgi:hypothetical protein